MCVCVCGRKPPRCTGACVYMHVHHRKHGCRAKLCLQGLAQCRCLLPPRLKVRVCCAAALQPLQQLAQFPTLFAPRLTVKVCSAAASLQPFKGLYATVSHVVGRKIHCESGQCILQPCKALHTTVKLSQHTNMIFESAAMAPWRGVL